MLVEEARELHHVDGVFADDFREFGIGFDHALVFWVLEIMGFDVDPELFGDLRAGEGGNAEEIGEIF